MSVYSAEAIDIEDLQTLFENNWEVKSNSEIPIPHFATSDEPRFDPSLQWAATPKLAYVNIYLQSIDEQQDGYAYAYVRQRARVIMDIWTHRTSAAAGGTNRQYLHDVKQEMRRIIYANKHSLANWQIMRYISFEEVYEDSMVGRFHGRITVSLENDGVSLPEEDVSSDDFTRSDGAIAGSWTVVSGTWEIVSNQAALQSATAGAITTYDPQTFKNNQRLQVDVVTATSMDAGIIFRYQDSSNYWRIVAEDSGGTKTIYLIEVISGTPSTRGQVLADSDGLPKWTDGDTIELAVDLYDNGISVEFNSLAIIQLLDSSLQTATGFGLYSNSDQNTRFDNFFVFESGGANR